MSRDVRVMLGRHQKRDTGRRGVVIQTPYDQDFVEELKAAVPSLDRAWWPDAKHWWVSEEWEADVIALVVFHYGETIVVDESGDEVYLDENGNLAAQQHRLI